MTKEPVVKPDISKCYLQSPLFHIIHSFLPLSSLLSLPASLLLAPLSYLPDPLYFIPSISNFLSPTTHYPASRFADDRSEDVDIEDAIESLQVNEQFSF